MSQFPWDRLKAETLRSICRDITGGTRLSRTKEEMAEFLQNVNKHGMKFDLPPPATSASATRTSRKRPVPTKKEDDDDKDAGTGATSAPKRRRISTRSTGDLKGIQTRGMKTASSDSAGKWRALSMHGKAGPANSHSAAASTSARKRRTPAKAGARAKATKSVRTTKAATAAKRSGRKRPATSARARRASGRKAAASENEGGDTDAEGEEVDEDEEEKQEEGENAAREQEKEKEVFDGVLIETKPASSAPRSQPNDTSATTDTPAEPPAGATVAIVTVTEVDTSATATVVVNGVEQQTEVAETPAMNGGVEQVVEGQAVAANEYMQQAAALEKVEVITIDAPQGESQGESVVMEASTAPAQATEPQPSSLLPELIVTAPSVVGSDTA